jgi:hypothetical protein
MGSTSSGIPSLQWAMIEDSAEEFLTSSSGEGSFGLPSPRSRGTGAPPAPIATTPWMENAPATRAMIMVPPQTVASRLDIGLPFEQRHAHRERQQAQAMLRNPSPSQKHHHSEASSPARKTLPRSIRAHRHTMSQHSKLGGS